MDTDSRKAERNSFAHHRASRLLVERVTHIEGGDASRVASHDEAEGTDLLCAIGFPIQAGTGEIRI
jgi:hypothetical protein